jgi:hypothetical protein
MWSAFRLLKMEENQWKRVISPHGSPVYKFDVLEKRY